MGGEWKTTSIGEVCEKVLTGGTPLKSRDEYFENPTVPWLKTKEVNFCRIYETENHISEIGLSESAAKLVPKNSVIVAMYGQGDTAGRVAINKIPLCTNQACCNLVVDQSKADYQFIYYKLMGSYAELVRRKTGSAQPNLNTGIVKDFELLLPPLPEQKAIAHILGTLDDKIELNRQMNATLEGMAQALFKSWFVDFDPVIDNALVAGNPIPDALTARAEVRRQALANGAANRETAKLFPAAFQFTEELGWIPEGWEVKAFDAFARLDTTSVKPFEQPETFWEHYSIPSYDSTGMPSLDRGEEIKSNKYLVKPGAILSSKLNPETERTWWPFMADQEASICSTEFMQFVPHKLEEQAFIYSLIRSGPFQANILERVTGSTGSRQRAQPKQIATIEVFDCGENIRVEFIRFALPLFESVRNKTLRIQALERIRNTLLPQLISGELRIPIAREVSKEALT